MISGIFTLAAIGSFIGVCAWAYARRNADRFADAARLPLSDEPPRREPSANQACCCREKSS